MTAVYYTCEHPPLLVQDNVCHLCNEFDGQTDCLGEIK